MNFILKILKKEIPKLKKKYPIVQLAVFGSAVRDDFDTKKSDIDIMVLLSKPDVIAFIELANELEKLLNFKVDLVSKNGIKPRYMESIKEDLVYV